MRHTYLASTKSDAGLRFSWSSRFGFVVLRQLAAALIAVNAYGQSAYLSSPKALLKTDPREFAQWLKSNRPKPVSELEKARMLASLPEEGEITDLDAPSLRKLASLKPLLLATGRASAYDIKVVDAPQARIVLYAPTVILISKTALTLLGAEELRAQVAHEMGHEYLWVDHARGSAREDSRDLKDLELLCDAIAIIMLHELGLDTSPLMTGINRVTRYNLKVYGAAVDGRNYPTLSERGAFARAVIAWVVRGNPPRSSDDQSSHSAGGRP